MKRLYKGIQNWIDSDILIVEKHCNYATVWGRSEETEIIKAVQQAQIQTGSLDFGEINDFDDAIEYLREFASVVNVYRLEDYDCRTEFAKAIWEDNGYSYDEVYRLYEIECTSNDGISYWLYEVYEDSKQDAIAATQHYIDNEPGLKEKVKIRRGYDKTT